MPGERKLLIGVVFVSLLVLGAGVFFLMRSSSTQSGQKVDETRLVREDSENIVSDGAVITLVEFSDFQCPACGSYYPLVRQLLEEFSGKITFVYRNFPLPLHQHSRIAAYAAASASAQGKFWEMHDRLFEEQEQWSKLQDPKDTFIDYAKKLGLDVDQFNKDLDSSVVKQKIERDIQDGNALGVNSTPTFYLNGEKLKLPGSYENFKKLIQAAIEKAPLRQAQDEPLPQVTGEQKYHAHFNINAYLNGKIVDFSLPKYQSTEERELNPDIHFHDGNGDVVHIHKKGVTLGDLFASFDLTLSPDVRLYAGDQTITDWASYQPQDEDRLLLSDSKNSDTIEAQKKSVKDDACIYSETCPERGKPPEEQCVGGLGTGCD